MTSMIATCSLDRKNLDVSCIIIIVTVKYLSSTMFHCCTRMSVQFITNAASLRKTRRKHYEVCHFDQDRIVALNLTSAFDAQKIFLQGKFERTYESNAKNRRRKQVGARQKVDENIK